MVCDDVLFSVVFWFGEKKKGWNMRDKKLAGHEMRFLDSTSIPFKGGKENFTPIYQQSKFKWENAKKKSTSWNYLIRGAVVK